MPHTFCLAFIVFSIIGATIATTVFRKILLLPYFFWILLGISFLFATVSAIIYLRRDTCCSAGGAKKHWKYLLVLYGTTIVINLLLFLVIFPLTTNIKSKNAPNVLSAQAKISSITLQVAIPCSGHAPLISGELQKIPGVTEVKFRLPNFFDIKFDQNKTSSEKILGLEVFQTYKAEILR
ncbi:MAG: hypothetical protein ACPLXP_03075 [Microgenomates group bacterium]